jgi:hypothetical protein
MPIKFTHFVRPTAQELRSFASAYWRRYECLHFGGQ